MNWRVSPLTRRYLDELAGDPEAARGLADLVRVSPLPMPFAARLLTRPAFLEGSERRDLEADLLGIHDLLTSLPERLFDGDVERYCLAVGFDPELIRLALRTSAEWPPPLVGRADLYRDGTGFKLLEWNFGSALGGFQIGEVNRLMLRADVVRAFVERERLTYVDTMPLLADVLRRRHHRGSTPVVVLADWPDAFPHWEPMLKGMAAQFHELGIDARPCHVGQLRATRDGLTLDGTRVDTVFRFFGLAQAGRDPEALALVEPMVRACERGQVELYTPLTTTLPASKRALTLLSDERHRSAFSSAERALIDRFLPWTRDLRDGPVHVDGTTVDLRELCLQSKDSLVLKPGHLWGGVGVVPGWTVGEREWRAAIDEAWDRPFVVQRRVVPTPEPFPDLDTGELEPWLVLFGVFVVDRDYGGCFIRCSRNLDVGVVAFEFGAWVGTCFHPEEG
jgi:hypothetical protein